MKSMYFKKTIYTVASGKMYDYTEKLLCFQKQFEGLFRFVMDYHYANGHMIDRTIKYLSWDNKELHILRVYNDLKYVEDFPEIWVHTLMQHGINVNSGENIPITIDQLDGYWDKEVQFYIDNYWFPI